VSKFNVILLGPIGTGKTSSLRTIPAAGQTLFCVSTEPGIESILAHSDNCHWHYIPPATADWAVLAKNANLVNTTSQDQLMKMPGVNRHDYRQFIEFLNACANFTCSVCGKEFGPVDHFPQDCVFAVDGLSGLSVMSMDLVAGGKPTKSQADWGTAMDNLERLLTKLCADTKCSFVLISHADREYDELTGGTKVMVSTLGRKLAPKIPRFFDEVVYCRKSGKDFWWSTIEPNVDLKARRLPFSDEIPPTFASLIGAR
jgi:hypothetical protein